MPAHAAGAQGIAARPTRAASPSAQTIIPDHKSDLLQKAPTLLAARAAKQTAASPQPQTDGGTPETAPADPETRPLIGGVIETDAIWNCTTCFACQEVCPVWAEPMAKITELRRNLVLEQASIPETAEGALRSIEDRGHPWAAPYSPGPTV